MPGRIRTCDPKFRKLVFYPTELRAHKVAGVKGLEPSTYRVTGDRSNQLSYTPTMYLAVPRGVEPLFRG